MRLEDRQWAGLLLFGGVAEFAIGLTIAEAVHTDYSVSRNYISDLGVGPAAVIFNSAIIIVGVAVVAAAWFLFRVIQDWILPIVVAIAGIGAIGVGIFTEDFPAVHGAFSLVTFVSMGLSAILAARVIRPPLRYVSIGLGAFSLAALGLFVSGTYFSLFVSETYFGLDQGGMERLIVWPVLVWGLGFGGYLLGAPATASQQPAA